MKKNCYAVTITGRNDRYGVDMTRTVVVESAGSWTLDALEPALIDLAKKDRGVSSTRIDSFKPIERPSDVDYDKLLDLDLELGI